MATLGFASVIPRTCGRAFKEIRVSTTIIIVYLRKGENEEETTKINTLSLRTKVSLCYLERGEDKT